MGKLLEIEYEKIFRPETMASLKGKSGESLKQMLGNKSLMQTIMRSSELIPEIIEAEKNHITTLEGIAVDMVTQAYPIIDYANIRIDAKIVTMGNIPLPPPEEEEPSPNLEFLKAKRRIINGITQGASIRGSFAFYLFKEYLDLLDDTLVDKYGEILKLSFGIYDSEEAIAMLLAMIAQNKNMPGGESQMEYDEEAQQFVIKARAICFPMLVHEIVKGLYEIVGTQGFGKDKEQNKAVIGAVDKLSNEPRDFQYGKFIYDALNNLYGESNIDDARVRELFFTEVYKLDEEEFVNFIENLINNKLTTIQKQWAIGEMKAIEKDLKKDDTGLAGLDEVKRRKKLAGILKEVEKEEQGTALSNDKEAATKLNAAFKTQDVASFANQFKSIASDPKVQAILKAGLKDGDIEDEKITYGKGKVAVKELLPTQAEIGFDQSIATILTDQFGSLQSILDGNADVGGPIVTYNGKYIIDGHHRWSQVYAANPNASMENLDIKGNLPPTEILKIVHAAIAAKIGEVPSADPKGINILNGITEKQVLDAVNDKLSDKAKQIWASKGQKDNTAIAKYIYNNLKQLISKNKPVAGAPGRKDMPQTDQGGAATDKLSLLQKGIVNFNDPKYTDAQLESLNNLYVIKNKIKIKKQILSEEFKRMQKLAGLKGK
jgi:hypothetical protein